MASKQQAATSLLLGVATCCCFLFLLICMTGQAARPEPRSSSIDHKKRLLQVSPDQGTGGKASTIGAATVLDRKEKLQGKGMEQTESSMMKGCSHEGKNKQDDEEGLMRRTLVAHTDYIYTQGKHN